MTCYSKESVLSVTTRYSNALTQAAQHCEAAARALKAPISEVKSGWKGEAGDAMVAKLDELMQSLQALATALNDSSSSASASGNRVYRNWPEEKPMESIFERR